MNGEKERTALCKFHCGFVTDHGSMKEVNLFTIYDEKLPEDKAFSTATPSGKMSMNINNPALDGFFKPGKKYLIEIREVPTPEI